MNVTFIIPTVGRSTLIRAVDSVRELDGGTRMIVVFDGVEPTLPEDNIVRVLQVEKLGSAGLVRNVALPLVVTDWTAFLDDDDYVKPTYTSQLKHYLREDPNLDIVIFSYHDIINNNTKPPQGYKEFYRCEVGISFAIRTQFYRDNKIEFQRNGVEDFDFLNKCRNAGARYILTDDVQYIVVGRGVWRR